MSGRVRTWSLVAVVLAATVSGVAAPPPAGAEGLRAVDIWASLGSAAPAVGCVVDFSVEVHDAGGPLPNVDVLVGLVVDGEVTASERAVSAEDGIAFLAVDTGYGYVGADARVEVNVAGAYVGQVPVVLTPDGPCSGDPTMLTTEAKVWAPAASAEGVPGGGTPDVSVEVPTYVQQRGLSCEYASLVIAMAAYGTWVSEYAFDERVGWSANPHSGFRGDIDGEWGNTVDYGVYPEPLVGPLADLGFAGEVFYGGGADALTARIDKGMPTLVWVALWGDTGSYEDLEDGTTLKLVAGYHVVVAYGYDEWGIYVSDPGSGVYRAWDWDSFLAMWNVMDGMALAVAPL